MRSAALLSRARAMAGSAVIALLALSACDRVATPATQQARPAVWKVADADTTIYLLGTVHQLPAGIDWQSSPAVRKAMTADTLWVELTPDAMQRVPDVLRRTVSDEPVPPVLSRVPPDLHAQFAELVDGAGIDTDALDRMETWGVALTLAQAVTQGQRLKTSAGVDTTVTRAFADAGKPIVGLETAEQQMALFDNLPEPVQRAMLAQVIRDADGAADRIAAMIDAWASGDTVALEAFMNSDTLALPGVADALMVNRNAAWAQRITARMDTPGSVLVAVGAGHLVGDKSVSDVLSAKGLRVERVP